MFPYGGSSDRRSEVDLLLQTVNPLHRLLVCLGYTTGFRISELLSLKVSNVVQDDLPYCC